MDDDPVRLLVDLIITKSGVDFNADRADEED